jgi:hypothetical protein
MEAEGDGDDPESVLLVLDRRIDVGGVHFDRRSTR